MARGLFLLPFASSIFEQNKSFFMSKTLMRLSDFDLQALVDGELEDEERRQVMITTMSSPENLARLDELLNQNKRLREWWAHGKKFTEFRY